jgi:hypothetical protein
VEAEVRLAAAAIGALVLLGCATVTPQERLAARAIPIMVGDPRPGCEDVGTVSGGSYMADNDAVRDQLRLAAARRGANYIRLDGTRPGYSIGTAFRCPETAAPAAPPALSSAGADHPVKG